MVRTRSQGLDESSLVETNRSRSLGPSSPFVSLNVQYLPKRRRTNRKQASSTASNPTTSGRVSKPSARRNNSLKVKLLNVDFSRLSEAIQQQDIKILQQQRRLKNFRGRYYPPPVRQYQNRYHFKFGHNPFQHLRYEGPSVVEQWNVYNLMKQDLKENFNKECFLDKPDVSTNELQGGPMHMTDDLSIDNLVKVILSISTENSLAIRQHAQLCSTFTYTINGKEVRGTVPNYHKMRLCPPAELVKALNVAGHQNIRQRAFHSILQEVYEQNVKRLSPWDVLQEGNLLNSTDFVPGLLSMEYLKGEGLSQQERFDLLVKFDQIAVKTGCCLLAFNMKIPVFVVDTHVHNMVRNLQWIPEDCWDADKACMFLDAIMPNRLKFGLHQAFWHHRINCVRCMPRANPKSLAYQQRICPLEHLMKRDLQPLTRVYVRDDKDKKPRATRTKTTAATTTTVKTLAASVTFLNMHYRVAEEKGYALRKVDIDDDFGDGSRQNKGHVANYYWGLKKFTHANDIVKIEDALVAVGIDVEQYEARFVKKVRGSKKKMEAVRAEEDVDMGDAEEGTIGEVADEEDSDEN